MKISKLIQECTAILNKHGDVDVCLENEPDVYEWEDIEILKGMRDEDTPEEFDVSPEYGGYRSQDENEEWDIDCICITNFI